MKLFKSFNEFVNENKLVEKKHTVKRKYAHKKSKSVYEKAPLRNSIVAFVGKKKEVSESELRKFLGQLSNQRDKKVGMGWITNNESLFDIGVSEDEDGELTYTLSSFGKKVFDSLELGYTLDDEFVSDDDFEDMDAEEDNDDPYIEDEDYGDEDDEDSYTDDDDGEPYEMQ